MMKIQQISSRSLSTSAAGGSGTAVDILNITDLVEKQHWSLLKSLIADSKTNPSQILLLLFDYGAASSNLLSYFRWSDRHFKSRHDLQVHCRLLNSLAVEKLYSKLRSELHSIVLSARHRLPAIFHVLSVSSDRRTSTSLIADMLLPAYVNTFQTNSALEAFRRAGDYRCTSSDDKFELLKKQLESNEKHRTDYLKRYDDAVSDKKRIAEDYSVHVSNLKSKCSTLEERCLSLSISLELAKDESAEWKVKYDHTFLEQKAEEESTAAEGQLAAVREQANSAKEQATEWKRKYEFVLAEAKGSRDRAAQALEYSNKKAEEREDALRAELSDKLVEKDEEIRKLIARIDHTELQASSLISRLEAAESGVKSYELESLTMKKEIIRLTEMLDSVKSRAQSHEKEIRMLEQEKNHLHEKYLSESKKIDAAEKRSKDAEREAKKAIELADTARAEASAAHKEKNEAHRLAMERLTLMERAQRQVESLEREKSKLIEEVAWLRSCELEATFKADSLERKLEERDKETEGMLSRSNEQRLSTVNVLESLLATERAALAEANNRAEGPSIQLQATQSKLDALQQEHTSVLFSETVLDSKLRTAQGNHSRMGSPATESVHDMDIDGETLPGKKRSKSTTSPLNLKQTEDGGSAYRGADEHNRSQGNQETESEDYTKFTLLTLKQELSKHGFGSELLQLKNPNKKDVLALYTKHIFKK